MEEPAWAFWSSGASGLKVSTRSHAYLRPAFWDRRPDSFVANVSAWYEPRGAEARKQVRRWVPGAGWRRWGRNGLSFGQGERRRCLPHTPACLPSLASQPLQGSCSPAPPSLPPASYLLQLSDAPSFYSEWIQRDLEPWSAGITRVRPLGGARGKHAV